MQHILIISGVFPPEPVTSATLNYDLAEELSKKYNVTVITPKPSRPMGFEFNNVASVDKHFNHIVVDSFVCPQSKISGRFKESYSFGKECVRYIRKHQKEIDFIYNAGWQFISLYLVAKECVKYKIPYIIPIQDIYPESILTKLPNNAILQKLLKAILSPIDRYYISNATRVRTISMGMAEYLSKTRKVDINRFLVIANWQDDCNFIIPSTSYKKDEKIRYMFAGNNNKQANVDLIIKSFVAADISNSELHIMGGGSAKSDCIKLVQTIHSNNIFFDNIPKGKVPEVQSKADVLVLALKEGTGKLGIPSKLTAYMLSGKPILASLELDSDTADMIDKAQCGYTVAPDNAELLAKQMKNISLLSCENLKKLGDNSRKYAEKYLTKQVNLNKVCQEIDNIIKYEN